MFFLPEVHVKKFEIRLANTTLNHENSDVHEIQSTYIFYDTMINQKDLRNHSNTWFWSPKASFYIDVVDGTRKNLKLANKKFERSIKRKKKKTWMKKFWYQEIQYRIKEYVFIFIPCLFPIHSEVLDPDGFDLRLRYFFLHYCALFWISKFFHSFLPTIYKSSL